MKDRHRIRITLNPEIPEEKQLFELLQDIPKTTDRGDAVVRCLLENFQPYYEHYTGSRRSYTPITKKVVEYTSIPASKKEDVKENNVATIVKETPVATVELENNKGKVDDPFPAGFLL
jgi:hypothetical protein